MWTPACEHEFLQYIGDRREVGDGPVPCTSWQKAGLDSSSPGNGIGDCGVVQSRTENVVTEGDCVDLVQWSIAVRGRNWLWSEKQMDCTSASETNCSPG